MKNFKKRSKPVDILESHLKVWEKTIDVQMHFNELQMKIRNFAILLISALVGAAGLAMKDKVIVDYSILWIDVQGNLSAVFFLAAAITWLAFFFMDHHWYYPLLIGAVKHGIEIENGIKGRLPLIGLTTAIGKESPQELLGITLRSKDKSFYFYVAVFIILLFLAVFSSGIIRKSLATNKSASPEVLAPVHSRSDGRDANVASVQAKQDSPAGVAIVLNQNLYNGVSPTPRTMSSSSKTSSASKLDLQLCKESTLECKAAPANKISE